MERTYLTPAFARQLALGTLLRSAAGYREALPLLARGESDLTRRYYREMVRCLTVIEQELSRRGLRVPDIFETAA
jgi:hypothetical protein